MKGLLINKTLKNKDKEIILQEMSKIRNRIIINKKVSSPNK
jgi:hypothetical protein